MISSCIIVMSKRSLSLFRLLVALIFLYLVTINYWIRYNSKTTTTPTATTAITAITSDNTIHRKDASTNDKPKLQPALDDSHNNTWSKVAPNIHDKIPPWLQEYIQFHKAAIKNAKQHRNANTKDTNNYLIFFCTSRDELSCSGTANQQRAIAAALMVSILTRRVFLIDIDRPVRLDQILSPNLIEWNYEWNKTLIKPPSKHSTNPYLHTTVAGYWTRNVKPHLLESPSQLMPNRSAQVIYIRTNGPATVNSLWKSNLTRALLENHHLSNNGKCPEQIYKWFFQVLYKPTNALIHHMSTIRKQLFLSVTSTYVGIHIRTGDSLFHHKKLKQHGHGDDELNDFVSCANKMKHQRFGKNVPMVLVTDNSDTRMIVANMDPFINYVNTTIIHTDLSKPSVNNLEGNLNVWSDIFLLTQANCTVRSRGSFSELGRRLGATSCSVLVTLCAETNFVTAP